LINLVEDGKMSDCKDGYNTLYAMKS